MKRLLLCFLLTPIISFPQNRISGLGPFKIGTTSLQDLEKIMTDQHQSLSGELQEDSITYIYKGDIFDLGAMTVNNLALSFYKDTLYKIECDCSQQLNEGLELKYGKAKMVVEHKTIHCRSGLKIDYTETETFISSTYLTATPHIGANRTQGIYFNDECKKRAFDNLTIVNIKTDAISSLAYQRKRERKELARKDSLKKQLSGL